VSVSVSISSSFSLSPVDDGEDVKGEASADCWPARTGLSDAGDDRGDSSAWSAWSRGCLGSECGSADSVRRSCGPADAAAAAIAAAGGCVAVRLSGEVNSACAAAMAGDTGDGGCGLARPQPSGEPLCAWSPAAGAVLMAAGVERTLAAAAFDAAAAFGATAALGAAAALPVSRRPQRLGDTADGLGEAAVTLADARLGGPVTRTVAVALAGKPGDAGPCSLSCREMGNVPEVITMLHCALIAAHSKSGRISRLLLLEEAAWAWQSNTVCHPHLRLRLNDGVQQGAGGAGVQLPPLLQVRVGGGPAGATGPLLRSATASGRHN
jgi:hypothetical protein